MSISCWEIVENKWKKNCISEENLEKLYVQKNKIILLLITILSKKSVNFMKTTCQCIKRGCNGLVWINLKRIHCNEVTLLPR